MWAVAEALWFFLVPEFVLYFLAVPRPRRALSLAAWATLGSVLGGLFAYVLVATTGSLWLLEHAPLVTPRMWREAAGWLSAHGAAGLLAQPLSGVPYKVPAYLAGAERLDPIPFLVFSLLARGMRIFFVSGCFALLGQALQRVLRRHFWWLSGLAVIAFALLLARTVARFA